MPTKRKIARKIKPEQPKTEETTKKEEEDLTPCEQIEKLKQERDDFVAAAEKRLAYLNGAIEWGEKFCEHTHPNPSPPPEPVDEQNQ